VQNIFFANELKIPTQI